MRRLLQVLASAMLLVAAACGGDGREPADTTDTRMPIATQYVRGASLDIHAGPSATSPVVTTYQNGEAVSVLSRKGEWTEIRTVTGSGWVHAADLSDAAEAAKVEADNLTVKFVRAPEPIAEPGAHGEIVLEAEVSSDGNVMSVRTLKNTTGRTDLEVRTSAALQRATFVPMVRHGQRQPFIYEHRVHY